MATMNRKLYNALRSIGVEDQAAGDVSEAISEDIIHLQKDVNLLKWIASINTAMLIALLLKTFVSG